jgi:hypothetical protein
MDVGATPVIPVAVIGVACPLPGGIEDRVAGLECEFFGMGERRQGLSRGPDT